MKYFILLLSGLFIQTASSQNYFYLEEIKLKKKSDFTDNEATVVKAVDYLLSTPADEKNYDRKACTRFIIRYAEKTPFITVTLDGYISKVYEGNLSVLEMFMGLWLKSAINNKAATRQETEEYIFTEIYKYAKAGNNIKRNDVINSLIAAGDENKIPQWLEEIKTKK